ncbi:MAG: hypothetical protein MJ166_06100 [Clostridia bacterium]|nr:hypothetical protein [Clostridia bacterium]
MDDHIFKSTQEQATAAWINHLNQLRLSELIRKLAEQNVNFKQALLELDNIRKFIAFPQNILGSEATKHGEIAENVQVYVSNARKIIEGLKPEYTFEGVGRLAPEDYLKNGVKVQSKFYSSDLGNRTFEAVCNHLKTYPDFLKNGGIYDIPRDQYEHIVSLIDKKPSLLSRSEYKLVQKIKEWEQTNGISFTEKVNPAVVDYADVQLGTVNETVNNEDASIREKNQEIINKVYRESEPTLSEGVKATTISATVEGGVSFCLKVAEKLRSGKRLAEFTSNDWKDIGISTAKGTGTGGLRGATIYLMTNYTATPASVASALVTATVGILTQAYKLKCEEICEEDFLINSQVIALEVSISAVSSLLGQVVIPIPVLGAVIGNAVGSFMFGIVKDNCNKEELRIIDRYNKSMFELTQYLDEKYKRFIALLNDEFEKYSSLVDLAFDEDVNKSFYASISLAKQVGVEDSKILKDLNDIDDYFLL